MTLQSSTFAHSRALKWPSKVFYLVHWISLIFVYSLFRSFSHSVEKRKKLFKFVCETFLFHTFQNGWTINPHKAFTFALSTHVQIFALIGLSHFNQHVPLWCSIFHIFMSVQTLVTHSTPTLNFFCMSTIYIGLMSCHSRCSPGTIPALGCLPHIASEFSLLFFSLCWWCSHTLLSQNHI